MADQLVQRRQPNKEWGGSVDQWLCCNPWEGLSPIDWAGVVALLGRRIMLEYTSDWKSGYEHPDPYPGRGAM